MYYLFKANKPINEAYLEQVLNSVIEDELVIELSDLTSGYIESAFSISNKLKQVLPLIEADYGDTFKIIGTPYLNALSAFVFDNLNELIDSYHSLADAIMILALKGHKEVLPLLNETFKNVPSDLLENMMEFVGQGSNVIESAKLMYIHRNTLNQRINKFVELTGLDLRDYEHTNLLHVYQVIRDNS